MWTACLLRLLITASSRAPSPQWGGPCKSDLDCSLNGVCSLAPSTPNTCTCDVGYKGEQCELFDFLPTPTGAGYGHGAGGTTSSWGGTAVYNNASGQWEGFFSEFVNHCGVLSWQSNSQIIHAVSQSAFAHGPFTKVGVALAAESHNAEARRDPVTGEYLLLHIYAGELGGKTVVGVPQCTNGSTSSCLQCPDAKPFGRHAPWKCCKNLTTTFPAASNHGTVPGNTILHHSATTAGPWLPVSPKLAIAQLQPSYCRDNPTSYVAPNGTVYIVAVCHLPGAGAGAGAGPGAGAGAGLGEGLPSLLMLWRGLAGWRGHFEAIGNITRSNGQCETCKPDQCTSLTLLAGAPAWGRRGLFVSSQDGALPCLC